MWEDGLEARTKKRNKERKKERSSNQCTRSWEPRNKNHTWVPKMIGFEPKKGKHRP